MPHQCVRCGAMYGDGSSEILNGCSCGAKLFFYVKKESLDKLKKEVDEKLTKKDRVEIEKDIYNMLGEEVKEDDKPVILDFESIRVIKSGKYELDLVKLFKKGPVIYKLEEGKYLIDLPNTFKSFSYAKKAK